MQQQIPEPPTGLGDWHQQRVDGQWDYSYWRDFAKDMCHHWRNRRQHILNEPVIHGARPTQHYMARFRSVTTPPFVSEPKYLIDPHQRASSSNAQQQIPAQEQCQPTKTQRPTLHHHLTIYTQPSNTQPRNQFMSHT